MPYVIFLTWLHSLPNKKGENERETDIVSGGCLPTLIEEIALEQFKILILLLKFAITVRYLASGSSNAGQRGFLKHLPEMEEIKC